MEGYHAFNQEAYKVLFDDIDKPVSRVADAHFLVVDNLRNVHFFESTICLPL